MKKLFLVLVLMMVTFCVFSAQYHTVPINDDSYKIIKNAELLGLISVQSDVKPYTLDTVKNLLLQIKNSGKISETEIKEIDRLFQVYDRRYGKAENPGFDDALKRGNIGFDGYLGALNVGVKASSDNRIGVYIGKNKILSSRNLVTAFIMGDIKDWSSFDMNMSFAVDKLDTVAYNFNDFEFVSDGQYFLGSLNEVYDLDGEEGFGVGLSFSPEITTSFLENHLKIKAGSFKRDWGSGINNIALSGSATKFDGIELQIEPSSWFRFSSLVGSLGITMFETVYGVNLPTNRNYFDNNFSIQRLEFTFENFKVNIFESTVWKKRFELSYISPFSIYWIAQNFQGDWDSLIGGIDFSYRFPGKGRLYLSFAVDEFTADLKNFFTNPRNIMAIQGGFECPVLKPGFGLVTFQATYIPPFFGSHYPDSRSAWGDGQYTVYYANGGKGLSYPLNPDSLEIMFSFSCFFGKGWSMDAIIKDQMQSAQYTSKTSYIKANDGALTNAGMCLEDYMIYDDWCAGKYSTKNLFANIWKNTLDIDLTVHKSFDNLPLELSLGLNGIVDWTRDFTVSRDLNTPNYGNLISFEDWNVPSMRTLLKIGFSLYY